MMSLAVAVSGWAGEPRSEEQKAIAEIEKFGGKVLVDETMPGNPVIDVQLPAANLTDADLERLKGLTHVVVLYLPGNKLTDAGLEHLKGFAELEGLFLTGNNVTDAGLKHARKLSTRLGRNSHFSGVLALEELGVTACSAAWASGKKGLMLRDV